MGHRATIRALTRGVVPAALLCATSAPGIAAPYTFGATVANACSISGKASTVLFGALSDSTTGAYTANGSHQDAQDDAASCNQGRTTAKVQRTNLVASTATQPTGYTAVIPLAATLTTTQGASVSDTSADPGTGTSTGNSGQISGFTGLKVTATLGSIGTNQLVSGTYTGIITVTLTPTS